ncbi:MAG: Prohibitin-1, subunit of the prohibitin complex (Phb1p-Phb2p), partial [Paramarteilia canceri]
THIGFSKEFTEAVEAKQVAQQDAERAKYLVEKAQQEKKAAVLRAEGDAQAASLLQNAFTKTGLGLIEFRKLEACEEIVEKLSSSGKVSYLPKNDKMLLNLGLK